MRLPGTRYQEHGWEQVRKLLGQCSLQALARELGFDGVVTSDLVHYFFRGKASPVTRAAVRRPAVAYGVGHLAAVLDRRHSLLQSDLTRITG